eukprot:3233535-Rhodomonas_salina.1
MNTGTIPTHSRESYARHDTDTEILQRHRHQEGEGREGEREGGREGGHVVPSTQSQNSERSLLSKGSHTYPP